MKRYLILLTALCLVLSFALGGCNKEAEILPNGSPSESVADSAPSSEAESTSGETNGELSDTDAEETSSLDAEESDTDTESQEDSAQADSTEPQQTQAEESAVSDQKDKTTLYSYGYESSTSETVKVDKADTSGMDFTFTEATDPATEEEAEPEEPSIPCVPASYTIIEGGTYLLSGTVTDKTVTVNAAGQEVNIILDNAVITNQNGPAIYVRAASKVILTLADGTSSSVSDGSFYTITESGSTLDAAIFSKADLTVNGNGTLNVNGNYKHGIVSKDKLEISSGTLNVVSKNIGINGKDHVKINSGSITVNAGTSGITSDNSTDATKGYVYIYGGAVNVTSAYDGIAAHTVINIEDVELILKTGGGSASTSHLSGSFKGLKAGSDIYVKGGRLSINSKDDCIHSNGTVTISGGVYTLYTADDAIHADTDLGISGASTRLTIAKSLEGIEATDTVIEGGTIKITTSGNGLDANGTLSVSGGDITVSVTGGSDSSVFKYDRSGIINGGCFFGFGTHSNEQGFSASSAQGSLKLTTGSQAAGTTVTVTDANGSVVFTKTADSSFSYLSLSHPSLVKGAAYTVSAGSFSSTVTAS